MKLGGASLTVVYKTPRAIDADLDLLIPQARSAR
jgi:hypothetical protein